MVQHPGYSNTEISVFIIRGLSKQNRTMEASTDHGYLWDLIDISGIWYGILGTLGSPTITTDLVVLFLQGYLHESSS
ncbi:uncharacterized protein ASPGLDRAFT_788763 [Aspergillus glaucus CBS 516.65]|uniref:Uncharacterized protein n=1 Tax=Aspergillus glaucus CBS 516.65 TaxID=1160497 RepID=A0A1L9VBH8_ASPGL|nr:hypothetical protein ASPGLDRAFT_788763 [Aspergillus glaucus CBS 516.65]OJJ81235.1 hypothetical protein ASPGLDRAFT_788763 [Aspergillus glaucus CBS 516.65]